MTFRAAGKSDLLVAGLWSLCSVAVAAAATLLRGSLTPAVCPFRAFAGVPCPTCGTTRAIDALLTGHPMVAIHLNPFVVVFGAAFLLAGLAAPAWVALRGPVPDRMTALPGSLRVALTLLFAANWIYLVIAGV